MNYLYNQLLNFAVQTSTPNLVFSIKIIENNIQRFFSACDSIFGDIQYQLYFPLKVAPHGSIANIIAAKKIGVEIINKKELAICKKLNIRQLIVSGNYKTVEFLSEVMGYSCNYIVCEAIQEIDQINKIAKTLGIIQKVLLRIKMTAYRRLGLNPEDLSHVLATRNQWKNIQIDGVHMHPGTNISDKRAEQSLEVFSQQIKAFENEKLAISYCNFGSGLPTFSFSESSLENRLKNFKQICINHRAKAMIEPGRPLVGDAAVLVATIHQVKHSERQIVVDTACYVINGPCGSSPEIYLWRARNNQFIKLIVTKPKSGQWRLGGIWPGEGDSLWLENLPEVDIGDKIIFGQAGAYSLGFMNELSFEEIKPVFLNEPIAELNQSI